MFPRPWKQLVPPQATVAVEHCSNAAHAVQARDSMRAPGRRIKPQASLAARTQDSFDPAALVGAMLTADGTPSCSNVPEKSDSAADVLDEPLLDTRRSSVHGEVHSVTQVLAPLPLYLNRYLCRLQCMTCTIWLNLQTLLP
jgi:hypothetical protein